MHTSPGDQLRAIKANDQEAIKSLYLHNYPNIEQYILQNSGSEDEAKDIYQEAFIAVWRNIQLDKFDLRDESSLNAYIYRVAKNKWLDQLRSAHHRRTVSLQDDDTVDEYADASEMQQHLDKIKLHFNELGDQCRDVLTRFYYRKESMRSIADGLNWTEATARNNKYRCLQKLRELFKSK